MFWAVAAAIMAALILIATLTPSPGTPTTPNIWCIACDELGALDVVANTVMFLPLGLTLALATGRRWATVVACAVLTLAIELLQVRVVIGRDASVSDLMANTLGGWIGAELALAGLHLLRPSDAVASRLTVAAAVLFALVCTLTSAGLRPAVVPPPLWIQLTPPRASFAPFSGRVLEFDVNGLPLNTRFPPGTRELERVLRGAEWRATVAIGTDGLEARQIGRASCRERV